MLSDRQVAKKEAIKSILAAGSFRCPGQWLSPNLSVGQGGDDVATMKQGKRESFLAPFFAQLRAKSNINIRNVRARHLKYMLIFPLAPVFANMQGIWFNDSPQLFSLDAMTLMGSAYCIGVGQIIFCVVTWGKFLRK